MTIGKAWICGGLVLLGFALGNIFTTGRPAPDCDHDEYAKFTVSREWVCESPVTRR